MFPVVPRHYIPGLLRCAPDERCDPRFAELNAAIQGHAAQEQSRVEARRELIEERAAAMRARYARPPRKFVAVGRA